MKRVVKTEIPKDQVEIANVSELKTYVVKHCLTSSPCYVLRSIRNGYAFVNTVSNGLLGLLNGNFPSFELATRVTFSQGYDIYEFDTWLEAAQFVVLNVKS